MKQLLIPMLLTGILSTDLFAEFVGPGAHTEVVTVKMISSLKDDTKVRLKGYLIKKIEDEHYIFKDATGEIEVEIDDEDFRGLKVTPTDKIRIIGEVDKDWNTISIDVKSIELVKP